MVTVEIGKESSFFSGVNPRYFSLARHALVAGLRAAKIGSGKTVLLPEFICRDLIASAHEVGASVAYYPVRRDLSPALPVEEWPLSSAVIAVDYFGFPQDLKVFQTYCDRTGSVLIEDNAHGYLSRDDIGEWLGLRGDIGIFSIRKTLPLQNGAVLAVMKESIARYLEPPLGFSGRGGRGALIFKSRLRKVPILGPSITNLATSGLRLLRNILYGFSIQPSGIEAERVIPLPPAAYQGFIKDVGIVDIGAEILRRRTLYLQFDALLSEWDLEPVFPRMGANVAPYGYVFRSSDSVAKKVQNMAAGRGLDLFRWPELPAEITDACPDYYKQTWVINFLW